jgi:hypothetical protein
MEKTYIFNGCLNFDSMISGISVIRVTFLTLIICHGRAQDIALPTFSGPAFFIELYGAGGGITANIEHKFADFRRSMVTARLGYGKHKYHGTANHMFTGIPITCSFVSGKRNHHRELGAGFLFAEGNQDEAGFNVVNKSIFVVPFIGYRYQRPSGGLFFKIQYTPLIKVKEYADSNRYRSQIGQFIHTAGISVGYFVSHEWKKN